MAAQAHTFLLGFGGGSLIGLAAAELLLMAGEVLGVSGIVSSLGLHPIQALQNPAQHWKLVFVAAFVGIGYFLRDEYSYDPTLESKLSPAAFIVGGLCVGFGTKLGNGCTSGHGICGLARLSRRSLVAVCTFMATGVLTASLVADRISCLRQTEQEEQGTTASDGLAVRYDALGNALILTSLGVAVVAPLWHGQSVTRAKLIPAAFAGMIFGLGLFLSRMVYPSVVLGFLKVTGYWDPTLVFVMGGGLLVSWLGYQFVEGHRVLPWTKAIASPLALPSGSRFGIPTNTVIDVPLVVGASIFGVGWGISGLCPGPALFCASLGVTWVQLGYWPAFFVGAFVAERLKEHLTVRTNQVTPERAPLIVDK